jgi:hypothetical protein
MNKDFEWCLQRGEVENLGMEETKERIKRKRVSFRALCCGCMLERDPFSVSKN